MKEQGTTGSQGIQGGITSSQGTTGSQGIQGAQGIMEKIYFIKNIYKNVKGESKIKIIDKDKPYFCNVIKYQHFEIRFVIDNFGNPLRIDSSYQFYTASVRRDMIINNLFNEI